MKFKPSLRACLPVFACLLFAPALRAQTPASRCRPPAPLVAQAVANIFTPQQEIELGDAIAEQVQRDFRIVGDPELTAHLQRIGERIVARMPQAGLRFRFFLFEKES